MSHDLSFGNEEDDQGWLWSGRIWNALPLLVLIALVLIWVLK